MGSEMCIRDRYTTGLAGQSDFVLNSSVYYDDGRLSARLAYRTRDEFFRPVGGNRIDDGGEFFDVNVSYKLNDNITFLLQGLNITDEPSVLRHVPTSVNAEDSYSNTVNATEFNGARWFAGARFKF